MAVQKSMFPSFICPEESLPDYILRETERHSKLPALVSAETGTTLTHGEVNQCIRQLAHALFERDVRKGDVVMLISPNHVLFPVVLIGASYIGAITALVNNNYNAGEMQYMIDETTPSFIFTKSELYGTVSEAARGRNHIKEIFVLDESEHHTSVSRLLIGRDPKFVSPVTIHPAEDLVALPFSSGTTGVSKAVMLTHRNVLVNVFQSYHPKSSLYSTTQDSYVCFLPLYHSYGLGVVMSIALVFGHRLVLMEKFALELYLKCIEKYKPKLLHVVPPVALQLAHNPISRRYDLSSVRLFYCGGAPLGSEVEKRVLELTGIPEFTQGYGLTETAPNTHVAPADGWLHGSCGKLVPNTEFKVINPDTGEILGPNKDGELLIRGPQVMKGYWRRPDATRQVIDDENFFHTGDIVNYDTEGNFFVVDRIKELIKWNGLQVAPAELETLLLKHSAILDVAVIGVPAGAAGETPRAFVVPKPGAQLTAEEVIRFVHDSVSSHKRLRGGVEFVDKIPKSPSGKILRRLLRDRLKTKKAKL